MGVLMNKKNPKNINILHLTDLHMGVGNLNDYWPTVEYEFYRDLEFLVNKHGAIDIVVFTGDITNRGTKLEFDDFNQWLKKLWQKFKTMNGSEPYLFTVPGNHDLKRPGLDMAKTFIESWGQNEGNPAFWEDPEDLNRIMCNSMFRQYTDWHKALNIGKAPSNNIVEGGIPGDFSTTIELHGHKIGIVGLNTSFLHLKDEEVEGRLSLTMQQWNKACGGNPPEWAAKHDLNLLITHHPPSWLEPDSQKRLKDEICIHERIDLHLFGHLHENRFLPIYSHGPSSCAGIQGASLFSREKYLDTKNGARVQRNHGYGFLQLSFEGNTINYRLWPRASATDEGPLSIIADTWYTPLDKDDSGTP